MPQIDVTQPDPANVPPYEGRTTGFDDGEVGEALEGTIDRQLAETKTGRPGRHIQPGGGEPRPGRRGRPRRRGRRVPDSHQRRRQHAPRSQHDTTRRGEGASSRRTAKAAGTRPARRASPSGPSASPPLVTPRASTPRSPTVPQCRPAARPPKPGIGSPRHGAGGAGRVGRVHELSLCEAIAATVAKHAGDRTATSVVGAHRPPPPGGARRAVVLLDDADREHRSRRMRAGDRAGAGRAAL